MTRQAAESWLADNAPSRGAAIAYYTIFSIAPGLLIVVTVAGIAFGREAAQGALLEEFRTTMGADAAAALEGFLAQAAQPGRSLWSTVVGLVLLLIGATTVLAELQDALNAVWRAPPRPQSTWIAWIRGRLAGLSVIAATGFILAVSLVLSTVLAAVAGWIGARLPALAALLAVLDIAISVLVTALFFATIYKILPDVDLAWHDVLVGAAVTSILFNAGKYAIAFYVSTANVASGYGAAGALIVVLVWVYYSAQIFLFGAEFTKVYSGVGRGETTASATAGDRNRP